MSFERKNAAPSFDDRLARLLSEEPVRLSIPKSELDNDHRYDPSAKLVAILLLVAVIGTWATAFLL